MSFEGLRARSEGSPSHGQSAVLRHGRASVADGPRGLQGQGNYSFDLGSWHLVALIAQCEQVGGCGRGSAEERWRAADLAKHHPKCLLAYWDTPVSVRARELTTCSSTTSGRTCTPSALKSC